MTTAALGSHFFYLLPDLSHANKILCTLITLISKVKTLQSVKDNFSLKALIGLKSVLGS